MQIQIYIFVLILLAWDTTHEDFELINLKLWEANLGLLLL